MVSGACLAKCIVSEGVEQGRQPELIGAGMICSAGGWAVLQMLRMSGVFQKSDVRIQGDGDFVKSVLAESEEKMLEKLLNAEI
jgi:putative transposase